MAGNWTRGATGAGAGVVAAVAGGVAGASAGAAMAWRGGDMGAHALRVAVKTTTQTVDRPLRLMQAREKTFKKEAII